MREQILNDLVAAMKSQDKETLLVIRSVKSAMQLEEINLKRNLNDDEVIGVITKQIKTRKDSLAEFEKGNRKDLVDATQKEIDILQKYLPEQLTEEELNKIIDDVFNQVKPTSPKDMGRVMATITPLVKGKADMKEVSNIIKSKLN